MQGRLLSPGVLLLTFLWPVLSGSAMPTGLAADSPRVLLLNRHPEDQTLVYAASELRKYVNLMAGREDAAEIVRTGDQAEGAIELGLFSDFGIPLTGLRDAALDDAISVRVTAARGRIAGSNPRSVLFGVYRFLEANGCRWLRPGREGEIVPRRPVSELAAEISDKAFHRFRGNNNCCSYSLQNILDIIDWAPKVGLNTFFNEFSLPKQLYETWYAHEWNCLKTPVRLTDDEVMAFHRETIREIKRRGLIYHAVGHGWSGAALGLTDSQANDPTFRLEDGRKKYLAMRNGERKQTAGFIHTDLCYGNPEVRRMMVRAVADYAEEHPEVDLLHVWMADGMNNDCECELCRNKRPSDLYVTMLNAMDRELTRRGIKTQLVFLAYGDLLWPPEEERFENPDRFVMMFAPSWTCEQPYDLNSANAPVPPFKLNGNSLSADIKDMMAFFHAWRRLFRGEAFVFDYHFIVYYFLDPGQAVLNEVLAEDIRRLGKLGIGGYVSCQNIRAFFPTGYSVFLHARLLWDPTADTEKLAREYFDASFGDDGQTCLEYLEKLSALFDASSAYRWRLREAGWTDSEAAGRLAEVPAVVEAFRPVIERNLKSEVGTRARSWNYLTVHADFTKLFSRVMRAKAEGKSSLADLYAAQLIDYLQLNEDRIQPVFDLYWFTNMMSGGARLFRAPIEKRGGTRR